MAFRNKDNKKNQYDPNKKEVTERELRPQIEENNSKGQEEDKSNDTGIKNSEKQPYIVELIDNFGSTLKKSVRIRASRYIEDGNVYLYNQQKGFKEPFPENTQTYKEYSTEQIEIELKDIEAKLKEAQKGKGNHSVKDLRNDRRVLNNHKRSLELQGEGTYMVTGSDADGSKGEFTFVRKGNYRLPYFWHVDLSLIYIPPESAIAEASDLIKENDAKNKLQIINLAMVSMIGVFVVLVIAGLYFAYKTANLNTELFDVIKTVLQNQDAFTQQLAEYYKQVTINETVINESVSPNVNVVN